MRRGLRIVRKVSDVTEVDATLVMGDIMTKLEIIEREIGRIRETLEVIANEEILSLVDELEMLLYEQRCILEHNYGN